MSQLALNYLHRLPKTNQKTSPPLLILIHGYGSNEADLFSFANQLPDQLLIVSVQAPLVLGPQSFAWYSIDFDAKDGNYSNIPEALAAKNTILNFIESLKTVFEFDHNNINLLGFSQGSILSYALALSHPKLFKNIIALSGYIKSDLFKITDEQQVKSLNFYMSHGTQDQMIPIVLAEQSDAFLTKLGVNHLFKTYHSGHNVTPQNFYDFNHWLNKNL